MKHLLEVDNISVSFATPHGQVEAVHGVSFYIDEGETVGIVGESGCGKSVTSQTVMKLLPPSVSKLTSGRIIWDGFNIEKFSEREMNTLRGKDMAMVFQDPMTSLNPVLTVGEQIEEGLRLHLHLSKKDAAEEAVRLLQSVGISGASQRVRSYPHELSGGMRQRCLIAAAIACKPRLLFADEPTTALDVTTEAQVLNVLQQMQEDLHMAVFLIIWVLLPVCVGEFMSCMPVPSWRRQRQNDFLTNRPIRIRKAFYRPYRLYMIRRRY